jgi:uncharacterized membrane protein
MKSTVAIYKTHDHAIEAIKILDEARFPLKRVSLIGKVEVVEDHIHLRNLEPLKNAPVFIGAAAGSVIGLLSGIGIFAIPGIGFIYGAGAVIGTIAGLDLGLVGGGIITLLATFGIQEESAIQYEEHVQAGKYLVVVQGTQDEINKAKQILEEEKGVLME